jgi:hypothetical protein
MECGSIASLGWARGSDFYHRIPIHHLEVESSRPSQTVRQPDPSFVMTGSQVRVLFAHQPNQVLSPLRRISEKAPCLHCVCKPVAPRLGVVMDSLMIGVAIVVALYIAMRLVLRFYFPPDT